MADLSEFQKTFVERAEAAARAAVQGVLDEMKEGITEAVGDAFTTNEQELRAELEDDYKIEPTELRDLLDEHAVKELSSAIRRGDREEAEHLLDRLVDDDAAVTEWVQQGRYTRRARAA